MKDIDIIFEPLKEYEGLYEINRLGEIRNVPKKIKDSYCLGYKHLNLHKKGKAKCVRIHRALALQFIPNPENKPYVNHINGVRDDNRLENLEWCTQSENVQHAYDIGLTKKYNKKLKKEDLIFIINSDKTQVELANLFNVTQSAISYARLKYKKNNGNI